jgi:hypothetical protein
MIIFQDYYPRLLSMCEAEGKSLCMIHLQHDDTVAMSQQVRVHRLKISIQEDVLFLLAMSQQVRVHRLKISIQEDVLFLLAMSQQVRVHRLKISIQEDVLFLLAMSQQVRVHWLKISIQGDVLFLLTHLFKDHVSFCHHLVFVVCCMS